jgi:hypothetical protein
VSVYDLFLAGAFAALFKQLNDSALNNNGSRSYPPVDSARPLLVVDFCVNKRWHTWRAMISCRPSIANLCRVLSAPVLVCDNDRRGTASFQAENAASGAAAHAVRARCCPLFYFQIRQFSGEAAIVVVFQLKVLNLLLALLPVHSVFLGYG